MGRSTNQPRNSGDIGALAGAEQFYVIPYGWTDAPWWSEDQVLNMNAIVDSLKRTYNIDENRVVVSGVSDGGTGAYYLAMRETTPFASFLPLNGFIMVLANIDTGIRDQLYPNNLRNKPFFVVNGGRDRLYPTAAVEPYVLHLKKAGVSVDYHPQPLGEHNTAWWPDVKESFERFAADHPRDPSPARLTWETSNLKHNRAHWLVIDRLGMQPGDPRNLPDVNDFSPNELMAIPLFERRAASGRVDLVRNGQHGRGDDPRRRRLHAARLTGRVRSRVSRSRSRRTARWSSRGKSSRAPRPCSSGPLATTIGRCSTLLKYRSSWRGRSSSLVLGSWALVRPWSWVRPGPRSSVAMKHGTKRAHCRAWPSIDSRICASGRRRSDSVISLEI